MTIKRNGGGYKIARSLRMANIQTIISFVNMLGIILLSPCRDAINRVSTTNRVFFTPTQCFSLSFICI